MTRTVALVLLLALAFGCDSAGDAVDDAVGCATKMCPLDSACMRTSEGLQCRPRCETDDECGTGYVCCGTEKAQACGLPSDCE